MNEERSTEQDWAATTDVEAPGDPDEAEVEILAVEIEQTRDEMTGTVEAIGDRLDPANIVADARQTVRDATVGKVEQMAGNVAETANDVMYEARTTAQDAGAGIVETIRRNPIPAAMAGIGIGWLLMNRAGGRSGSDRRRMDRDVRWQEYDAYGSAGAGRSFAGEPGLRERAGERAGHVGQQAGEFVDQARSTVGRVPDQVGETVQDVRWNGQRMIEENPLAAGAIAVAVGTAIGLALPETQAERDVLGPAGEKAIETAERAADEAKRELQSSRA